MAERPTRDRTTRGGTGVPLGSDPDVEVLRTNLEPPRNATVGRLALRLSRRNPPLSPRVVGCGDREPAHAGSLHDRGVPAPMKIRARTVPRLRSATFHDRCAPDRVATAQSQATPRRKIMAKKDADLFDRLRQVGLRKQAAKALSGVSDKTGKNAQRVARATVAELRALADEIERRLPAATPTSDSSGKKNAAKPRPRATTRRSTSASAARTPKTGAAKPRRPPRSSTTPGAGRGSGSRPTPPPAASTERAAPTPDPAEPPPAAGTERAAPTPDPAEPPPAAGTERAAPTPDPAEPPPAAGTERAAPTPDPAEPPPAAGTESAAPTPDPAEPPPAASTETDRPGPDTPMLPR